ncbi:MAG: helix-turn-helix transcriptional regulator [Odoribacter sp.]
MKQINRLKVVLVEKNRSGKWLAEQLGKDPATISRWCNNHAQPSIETFTRMAEMLDIDVRELLNKSK